MVGKNALLVLKHLFSDDYVTSMSSVRTSFEYMIAAPCKNLDSLAHEEVSWQIKFVVAKCHIVKWWGISHTSTSILSPLLIQEGQLSVFGKRMCTILVNRLQDYACPIKVSGEEIQSVSVFYASVKQWFIYNFIPMPPRTRLGYIKWVLLENPCVHYRIFHYNFVSPGTCWDLKYESQSKNVSTGLGMRR